MTKYSQSAKDFCQYFKSEPDMHNVFQAHVIIGYQIGAGRLTNALSLYILFVSLIFVIVFNQIQSQTIANKHTTPIYYYISARHALS